MSRESHASKLNGFLVRNPWLSWAFFFASMTVVFLLGLLASSIMERRTEALIAYRPAHPVEEFEPRNSLWGENFPRQYSTYLKTSDTSFESKYGTSGLKDELKDNPRLVILWAGYAFAKDYSQPRGHYYSVTDVRNTLRTRVLTEDDPQTNPATCWTCKSSDVPRLMNEMGADEFYRKGWEELGAEVVNPIGCGDCHDPETMNLRLTRPALVEAFERQGVDVSKATHQEMRSLVCAQCHVEYYFRPETNELVFPWDLGTSVEDMEEYYDRLEFNDWVHPLSRAPLLKAQHPEYETWLMGTHARRGVSCADCHMPYISEGGVKYTDHHVQSPLNNISRSCQVCHRQSEEELLEAVYSNQDKVYEVRIRAEEQLVRAHIEAKAAWDAGASTGEMEPVLELIRHSQWRWDFAVASHGASFHAPLEMNRILGSSVDKAGQARVLLARILARRGVTSEIELPDISTKEKAQAYVGLDMDSVRREKIDFLDSVVPKWDAEAKARQEAW